MYDTDKLFRLMKRDLLLYSIARDVLDYMLFVEKSHSVELNKALGKVDRLKQEELDVIVGKAPEYLSIGIDDKGSFLISKMLKRHFNSEAFRQKMSRNQDIDNSGIKKIKESDTSSIKLADYDILAQGYKGLLPTVNYIKNKEVFVITNAHKERLKEKFPSKDIDSELRGVFNYFADNPHARKAALGMRTYIARWISGDLAKNARKSRSHYALGANSFYEDLRNNGI